MKSMKRYWITLLVGFAGAALIAWSKDLFAQTAPVNIFHILSDAFFVVGVVITSGGLLVFSTNEGTFDMLVYGVSSFFDMFRKVSAKKYETFYDYRASRADKKLQFGFMLICGLIFLAIAGVMYLFYRQYA